MSDGNIGRKSVDTFPISASELRGQKEKLTHMPPPRPPKKFEARLNQTLVDAKQRLKPLAKEQRYMVSPHALNVGNFFENARGMGKQAIAGDHNIVKPVFKSTLQRLKFNKLAKSKLSDFTVDSPDHQVVSQLIQWSDKGTAMMDFSELNAMRSQPIVYVQGHGSAGSTSITSDSENLKPATATDVAEQLVKMKLPRHSEIRANSCHSGTQHIIDENTPFLNKIHQEQSVDINYAGDWNKTFAGALQDKLSGMGQRNRVAGYMGPTYQQPLSVNVLGVGGMLNRTQTQEISGSYGTTYYKRRDMRRYGPTPMLSKK